MKTKEKMAYVDAYIEEETVKLYKSHQKKLEKLNASYHNDLAKIYHEAAGAIAMMLGPKKKKAS